jgi:uncharacterized protein YegL
MAGPPIAAVNEGLHLIKRDLGSDPRAIETVAISMIAFGGDRATLLHPPTDLPNWIPPVLSTHGGTPLGSALSLVNSQIDHTVAQRRSAEVAGDWKPLLFLFTDGEPTDDYRTPAKALRSRTERKMANFVAIGCGPNVNTATLRELSEVVLLMRDASPGSFASMMAWISQSLVKASAAVAGGALPGQAVGLAPLPPELKIVL